MGTVEDLIASLEDPRAEVRLQAANWLGDRGPRAVAAIGALLAHLEDEGAVDEQWTDWDGTVVGGTTHHVADRVLDTLTRIGAPAFEPVVAEIERRCADANVNRRGRLTSAMSQFVVALPVDSLGAAGADVIARARRLVHGEAAQVLAWAQDELARVESRIDVLARRLDLAVGQTAELAAKELGTVDVHERQRAAALLAELVLREDARLAVKRAAAASLDTLGPVLDPATVARLVEAAPTRAMFHCWPELLPAVARYREAAALGPWLLAWVRDDKVAMSIGTEHHANVRAAAAAAIARLCDEAARSLHDELVAIYAAGPAARRALALRALSDRSVIVARLGAGWRDVLESAESTRAQITAVLDAIEGVGAAAAPLADALLPFVDGPRAYYRATLAVGRFGEAGRAAVPALIRALGDPASRMWACFALRDLGREIAAPALDALDALAAGGNAEAKQALESLRAKG